MPIDVIDHAHAVARALPACRFRFPDPARRPTPRAWSPTAPTSSRRRSSPRTGAGSFPGSYDERMLLWWSPDPRAILPPDGLHVARRLARTLRQGRFRVTLNAAFPEVIDACAARAETWITPAIREAYVQLHRLGWAHSVEVWVDATLAGGLYGLAVGGLFAAESMFHRARDASKVARRRAGGACPARGHDAHRRPDADRSTWPRWASSPSRAGTTCASWPPRCPGAWPSPHVQ